MSAALIPTIAGLRACKAAGTPVSPTLRDAALESLIRVADHEWRRSERNRLVCAAGSLLAESTIEGRAKALLREKRAMLRTWHALKNQSPRAPEPTVRDLLREAHLIEDLPDSLRQFRRLLGEAISDIDRIAMSAKTD